MTDTTTGYWDISEEDKKKGWKILKEKLTDVHITDDEISTRTAEIQNIHPNWLPPSTEYVFSLYPTPLTRKLKSELLAKAWIMMPTESTFTRHVPKHGVQEMAPDNHTIEFVPLEYVPPEEDAGYRSLHSEDTWHLYSTFESDTDKELYKDIRKHQIKDTKYAPQYADVKLEKLKKERGEDYEKQEAVFYKSYTDLVKQDMKNVVQEVDDWSWCPAGQKEKPVWKDGGYHFKEWEKEMKELLQEYVNSDERV